MQLTTETSLRTAAHGTGTALAFLECPLCLLQLLQAQLEFGGVDFGSLVKPGVLDGYRRGNGERLGQAQVFGREGIGLGRTDGKDSQNASRGGKRNGHP